MFRKHDNQKKPPLPKYYIVIYAVLLSIFFISAYKLIQYYYNNYEAERLVDNLTQEKEETEKITDEMLSPRTSSIDPLPTASPSLPLSLDLLPEGSNTKMEIDESKILTPYRELYKENNDLAGWITIPGTKIDYPVMYTKDDNTTYLHTDFQGKTGSRPGCIFIDGRSNFFEKKVSSNLILYGHNMKIGTMFHDLMNYKLESYYLAHPVIRFDSIYEIGTYDILAVFPFDIESTENIPDFLYYNYYNVSNEKEFNKYLAGIQTLSLYDTGISAQWGDQLITLSTCAEYDLNTTKRFVVVAKKRK